MLSTETSSTAKHQSDFVELSVACVAGLAFALIAMFLCSLLLAANGKSRRDFVIFWATGQQFLHHRNPYDPVAMGQLEHDGGFPANLGVFFMRNPPWALPMVLPLGLTGIRLGNFLWTLVLLGAQIGSGWLIWDMFARPPNRFHWLAISFAPSLICLFMGQTALFALLGLVLFLRFHTTYPFAAGLALWFCILKPHLFLPSAVVLLAWVIVSRSYMILAGSVVALGVTSAVTTLILPSAWSAYNQMMHAPTIAMEPIPCLSVAMRLWISPQAVWLQFLPAALACIWALAYYWSRRETWDWVKDGSVLVLVSIVAAPYCWVYDQCITIAALLPAAYTTRSRILLVFLALVNIPIFGGLILRWSLTGPFYVWLAPVWLAWYLAATALARVPVASKSAINAIDSTAVPVLSHSDSTVQGAK